MRKATQEKNETQQQKEMQLRRQQEILINRINEICRERGYSYYTLSYKSSIPLTTLIHILDGSSKNPGIFTIIKICDGLEISLKDFFDTEDFQAALKEVEE